MKMLEMQRRSVEKVGEPAGTPKLVIGISSKCFLIQYGFLDAKVQDALYGLELKTDNRCGVELESTK